MPMIQWSGGPCPLPPDTPVRVVFNDGFSSVGEACDYSWEHETWSDYVTAYEVLTPKSEQSQWEYTLEVMPRGTVGEIRDYPNRYGADGWELCLADFGHLIFKRRKA